MSLSPFLTNSYSEDQQQVSEAEYDEVMQMMADDADGWQGYEDFSRQLERSPSIENFIIENGKVRHKPEPKSNGRLKGYEL